MINITADSEIARLLEAASEAPILLEMDGEVFRPSKSFWKASLLYR